MNKSREDKMRIIEGALTGKLTAKKILDEERLIVIETKDGYREINGAHFSKEEFEKWQDQTNNKKIFIIPDNGR